MKVIMRSSLLLALCSFSLLVHSVQPRRRPRVTVVIVADQLAYHYIPRVKPYLKYGLRFLLHHGIVYENAYYPHALTLTGPGCAGLATGALPSDHGIIANVWTNTAGHLIACDDDTAPDAAVFSPTGTYPYGKSAHHIMVDSLTDQFMLSETPCDSRDAYAISLKSAPAICTATTLGKAIWFDEKSGNFTSSKAYFDSLPQWLTSFNKEQQINTLQSVSWDLAYPCKKAPYCFKNINTYTYAANKEGLAGKSVAINHQAKNPYALFEQTPVANELLFDCALACIEEHMDRKCDNELLLWLCLSPLEEVSHVYGPQSLEAIDMIYHLDKQLDDFMHRVNRYVKRTHVLYVVTADHGICPLPELMHEKGYTHAQRINATTLIDKINKKAAKTFDISLLIEEYQAGQLMLNEHELREYKPEERTRITTFLKNELQKATGIKQVWTYDELANSSFEPFQLEAYYKNHLYPGRTSSILVQTNPYCIMQEEDERASHGSPYEYDTHVPLILYQKGNVERRLIHEKVWALQLANSLAYLLDIPKPSASFYPMLPGLVDYDPLTGEAIVTAVI